MTSGGPSALSRRTVLRWAATAGALAVVPGCSSAFADTRLTIATGFEGGVYYRLGTALAQVWMQELGLRELPRVEETDGSVDNLELLNSGRADVVISQVDVAADDLRHAHPEDPRPPRALARIYDDVLHVVVPADSPVMSLPELRGLRVSVGAERSGVSVIARRLLTAAGLASEDLQERQLGLPDSTAAMRAGEIDAFFWSGGLPTEAVTTLSETLPIRLLDLTGGDVLNTIVGDFPVYEPGTVPAQSYVGLTTAVSTLRVRNFLLVSATMPDDLAEALVRAVFAAQGQLAQAAIPTALTIDPRAAIGTQPVELHPGAARFYRDNKD